SPKPVTRSTVERSWSLLHAHAEISRPGGAREGDGAPKSADLWLRIRCRMRQAPLGAPIADVYRHRAPLFVAGRSWAISWLPGPRNGSGGSPDTVREPDRASAARRRRTSSRFMNAS